MTVEATGARRYWLIWVAVVPIALWALVRTFGLESGGPLTSLMWFTPDLDLFRSVGRLESSDHREVAHVSGQQVRVE
jgi:hypothetical protein